MCKLTENRRPLLLGLALLLAVAALVVVVGRSPARLLDLPLYDYVAFWAAGRLDLQGQDPFDPALLTTLEKEVAPGPGSVLVMWSAPWGLTLVMPFSLLDARLSHLLWLAVQFAVLAFAVDWSWRLAGGPRERRWLAWLVALTYLPCYLVLVTGQIGALLLLGLVGFLHCLKRGRDARAGAFLVLTAIKPQLTYLFWVALLLWAWQGRRWRLVLGGVLGGAAMMAWPLLTNPELPVYYWHALTQRTQTHSHLSPLVGTALRLTWGRFGLQFVPMVPGLLWLAWYWRRHRLCWDWEHRLPALLFASLLTTAYGAWPFDLVLLLPVLMSVAVRLLKAPRRAVVLTVGCHLAINLLALVQLLGDVEYIWFVWLTPALLLAWALAQALLRPAPGSPLAEPLAA